MKSQFLRYLGCLAAVLIGVAAVDRVAGAGLDRLLEAVPVSQDIGKGRFAINHVKTDIVIVGSSRAAHHYIPTMIEDSLGCSTYNVGRDGCFFHDNICVANAILNRYSPKILILEILNDCLYEGGKSSFVGMFPYYWKYDYIKEVIDSEIGWQAPIQLSSKLYAYNASSFKLIGYGVNGLRTGTADDPLKGYAPLQYVERRVPMKLVEVESSGPVLSQKKCSLLKELLEKARSKDVEIILICSPTYKKFVGDSDSKKAIIRICAETGMRYYDFSSISPFTDHPEWFRDATHMNVMGAEAYTEMVIRECL